MTWPLNNLPAEVASFIGRREELAEVERLIEQTRLLTLTGVGGTGKTRLALRAASAVTARFADGVCLVELAPLGDSSLVARTIAGTLGIRGAPSEQLQPALVTALSSRRILLVIDNCEHVIGACAQLVDTLLRGCPRLRILATSREPLRVPGEVLLRVPQLATVGEEEDTSPDALTRIDAVALFVARAVARRPDFRLTEANARTVSAICRELEGLPLAIELAAAQMGGMTPDLVAVRLDDALRVLAGGDRTLPRQETLRATLDWSHGLLTINEQTLFRRLAVFAGSFLVEAAEAVGSSPDLAKDQVFSVLIRLVEKSLVEPQVGANRYRLLETVRQYSWRIAKERGEATSLQRRHAHFFLELAEGLEPALMSGGPAREQALKQLAAEQENLRAALGWTRDAGTLPDVEVAFGASAALTWYWTFRGETSEGLDWLESLLGKSATPGENRAKTLYSSCELAWLTGHGELARRRAEQSEAEWRRIGDKRWLAYTLQSLPLAVNHPNARNNLEESLALFEETGDLWGRALAVMGLEYLALAHGEAPADEAVEQSMMLWRDLGDDWGTAQALNILGDFARISGKNHLAERCYRDSLSLLLHQGLEGTVPSLLHNLGWLALRRGQIRRALQLFRESLSLFTGQGDQRGMADVLAGVAATVGAMRQPEQAAWLFGSAEALRERLDSTIWPANIADYEASLARVREQIDEDEFLRSWRRGKASPIAEVLDKALPKRRAEGGTSPGSNADLTAREREVAALVAQGMTNREIGAALFITEGTARLHVKHILAKLEFRSRTEIAAWMVAQG